LRCFLRHLGYPSDPIQNYGTMQGKTIRM
jgi:hypothetical protein